ncbi:MAG: VPLPA-CTERM sorting domain-containing protein [Pseudomonadota bacterium]
MNVRALIVGSTIALTPSIVTAAPVVFSGSAGTPGALAGTVDAYRDALGALNAPEPVNNPDGRRQIDWDAAPDAISDPNAFPGDFFNGDAAPRARGIEFQETNGTTGFALSANDGVAPVRFGQPDQFTAFSEQRLFAPLGGTTFDVKFFDPVDQTTPATTRGLGVVFTDVEVVGSTTMTFFDIDDNELLSLVAPVGENGDLSFTGAVFDQAEVFRVAIMAGMSPIDGPAGEIFDVVAMDDFIFGEMSPVPLPASVLLMGAGIAGLGALRRLQRRA